MIDRPTDWPTPHNWIAPRAAPLTPEQRRLFANVLEAWIEIGGEPTLRDVLTELVAELRRPVSP